jgi:glycerol-3-phosphate acyltransferase PlsY
LIKLALIIAVVSYLLGSIPFGYLLVRIFRGQDVRHQGSGNIGATNVARTGSKGLAIATLILDAAKGYLAVQLAMWLLRSRSLQGGGESSIYEPITTAMDSRSIFLLAALAAFCAILGHIFTPWLGFKGGKGVATAAGAFLALEPRAMLAALVVFGIVVAFTRYVSLASIVAVAAFPAMVWWLNPARRTTTPILLLIALSSLLIIVRHKDNIRRLLSGSEHRFR